MLDAVVVAAGTPAVSMSCGVALPPMGAVCCGAGLTAKTSARKIADVGNLEAWELLGNTRDGNTGDRCSQLRLSHGGVIGDGVGQPRSIPDDSAIIACDQGGPPVFQARRGNRKEISQLESLLAIEKLVTLPSTPKQSGNWNPFRQRRQLPNILFPSLAVWPAQWQVRLAFSNGAQREASPIGAYLCKTSGLPKRCVQRGDSPNVQGGIRWANMEESRCCPRIMNDH